jgi:hypothetical protein
MLPNSFDEAGINLTLKPQGQDEKGKGKVSVFHDHR